MSDRDAQVRAIPRTEGTKPTDEGRESMPLDREAGEARGGVRGGHSHAPNDAQAGVEFDLGVAREHVRSTSQGARPEDAEDATLPGAEGATTIEGPGDEPVGGGPSGDEFAEASDGDEPGPGFEPER